MLPADEELAMLLPQLLDLVSEPPGRGTVVLLRPTGEQLDVTKDLASLGVRDGELLRLARADDAPPPPETADVTEATSTVLDDLPDRWGEPARRAVGAAAVGLFAGSAGLVLAASTAGRGDVAVLIVATLLALLVLAATARRAGPSWRRAVSGSAAACLGPAVGLVAGAQDALARQGLGTVVVVALAVACLALAATGFAVRSAGRLTGAVTGLALAALALVLFLLGIELSRVAAVVAVACVVLLGLLPMVALSASGVHRLDDATIEGRRSERAAVVSTVEEAYRTLTWFTIAVAVVVAAAASVLVTSEGVWVRGLGALVVLIVALRTPPLPLVTQAAPLWAAAATATVLGAWSALGDRPVVAALALSGVAVGIAVVAARTPSAQQRARRRRAADALEGVCVLALVPTVLGVFGVYQLLLGAF